MIVLRRVPWWRYQCRRPALWWRHWQLLLHGQQTMRLSTVLHCAHVAWRLTRYIPLPPPGDTP